MDSKVVQWVTRSTPLESRGAWKRFVQERKGFDDGGRVNYAIGDLVYENLPEQTGDAKLDRQRERLGSVAKDERFVKRLSKGKSKYWPFKSDSVLITQSDIDNSHLVNNLIKKNKGFLASPERFAVELFGKNKDGKPVNFKGAMRALVIAMDNFKEAENVKFATDVYKNIDAKKFSYLEMVAKSIAQSKNAKTVAESGAAFLPENMVTHYPKILARGGEKGLFNIGGKIKPADKKFLIDRITQLTGEPIDLKQLDNTLKFATESRTAEGRIRGQIRRLASMNTDIRKLYDDPQISKLIKGDLDNKTRQKILDRAVDLVGDDVAIASRRLFQMAESMAGTRPIEGIVENKKLGNKLIDTQRIIGKNVKDGRAFSSLVYNHYAKAIDNVLGTGPGKSFIGYYQTKIKNALDAGMVPDEIFSVTASARRGMHPYAIFTQALDADVNSSIKGANLDGLLSGTHERLQKIFKGRTYDKLNAADKKEVQKLVSTFENAKKNVLKDLKPEIRKNIQLPEFDLKNPPSKSLANYKSYDKNLQRAFDTSYKNVGYSMKVPKYFQTQKELYKKLLQKKVPVAGSTGVSFLGTGALDDWAKNTPEGRFFKKSLLGLRAVGAEFEAGFIALDYMNNISKGDSPDVAFKSALQKLSLDLYKGGDRKRRKEFTDAAVAQGISKDDPRLKGALKYYDINTNYIKLGKLNEELQRIETISQDIGETGDPRLQEYSPTHIDGIKKQIANLEKIIDGQVEEYIKIAPEDFNPQQFFDQNVKYIAAQKLNKTLDDRAKRVNPEMGTIGSDLWESISDWKTYLPQNLMETGLGPVNVVTRPVVRGLRKLPGIVGDIWDPTSEAAKLSAMPSEERKKRIEDMGYKKAMYDPRFQTWNLPDPYLQGVQSLYPSVYENYAGGGIAGIRRPHAIPPKSGPMPQGGGLSSMFNRVRKW